MPAEIKPHLLKQPVLVLSFDKILAQGQNGEEDLSKMWNCKPNLAETKKSVYKVQREFGARQETREYIMEIMASLNASGRKESPEQQPRFRLHDSPGNYERVQAESNRFSSHGRV